MKLKILTHSMSSCKAPFELKIGAFSVSCNLKIEKSDHKNFISENTMVRIVVRISEGVNTGVGVGIGIGVSVWYRCQCRCR